MDAREVLTKLKNGEVTVEEAELYFRRQPFEELGYAKLDTHRKLRSGFPEVIFCMGKADKHLLEIVGRLYEAEGEVMGTRATKEQFAFLKERYPLLEYDEVSKIIKIGMYYSMYSRYGGYCCSGGSSPGGGIFWSLCGACI